ncbi:MAG: radical SAM protein, partial [Deltaproteobacteria bacterium]|nr:radical SAM protein [Deltaproteobacteria bacterium]
MSLQSGIILVGRQPAAHENLALQYLNGAARNAGIDARVLSMNGFNEITVIADEIMMNPSAVIGLSITDATCAVLLLSLGTTLAQRGYRGHITCGGGWATLQRRWLLEHYQWLDSVVRFDGEAVLPELVATVVRNGDLHQLAGVTTRNGDGRPAPVHADVPMNTWPSRDALPEILNFHAASLIASRGCMGNCEYCGPAALQRLEREEARKNNAVYPCHNGRVRRRTVDDITDEMAYLYHKRDVRYFGFADEHLLPTEERAAHAFLDELTQQLRRKKVRQYGFGGQISASQMTPSLCDALVQAGMVRAHLGIDLIDDGNAFGRSGGVEKQFAAVRLLNAAGIPTISNVLLLHPYATAASMQQVLRHLNTLDTGYVEFAQMQAFAGTALTEKLRAEGRLFGNPLRYLYTFDTPALSRFEQLFASLRSDAFGRYSIMYRLHEMAYRMALAKRVGLAPSTRCEQTLERYRKAALALALQAYADAIRICENSEIIDRNVFVNAYRMGGKLLENAFEKLESDFHSNIAYVPKRSSFTVNAVPLLALLAFSSAAACQDVTDTLVDTDSTGDTTEKESTAA